MSNRTCNAEGCGRPHYSKGMCRQHYRIDYRKRAGRNRQAEYFERECIVCTKAFRSSRRDGKFCSDTCKGRHYSLTTATRCALPADHPVRLEMKRQREALRKPKKAKRSSFEWRTARECPGCACMFTPTASPHGARATGATPT